MIALGCAYGGPTQSLNCPLRYPSHTVRQMETLSYRLRHMGKVIINKFASTVLCPPSCNLTLVMTFAALPATLQAEVDDTLPMHVSPVNWCKVSLLRSE